MKIFLVLLLFISLSAFATQRVLAEPDFAEPLQTTASPVVVELFSSQKCPACPPADEFMKTVADMKGVIALSCHVDYFGKTSANLGKEFCTEKQTQYIKQIGRKAHFTPQMMVNGHMSKVGYETAKVSAAIVKGRSERLKNITINPKATGVFNYRLQQQKISENAQLWIAVFDKPKTLTERGKATTYYNVVRHLTPLEFWYGEEKTKAISPILNNDSAGFAIFAQDTQTGKILAAGQYQL